MKFRRLLCPLLAFCLCGAVASAAPARRASSKSAPAAKNKSASAKSGAKTSSKTAKGRSASSSSRKRTAARVRPSGPPRQAQPTAERYMEIQQALAEQGFYEGPVDGNWTASCVEALKRFQADQHLAPDGKLGALSIIALGLGPKRDNDQSFLAKPEPAQ